MTRAVESGLIVLALFALLILGFWLFVEPAYPQANTHRWRDCHQNARRETVCRECWLEASRRRCTQARVMVRL